MQTGSRGAHDILTFISANRKNVLEIHTETADLIASRGLLEANRIAKSPWYWPIGPWFPDSKSIGRAAIQQEVEALTGFLERDGVKIVDNY